MIEFNIAMIYILQASFSYSKYNSIYICEEYIAKIKDNFNKERKK